MPRASCLVPQITSAGRAYRKQFRFRVTLIPKLIPKLRLGISLGKNGRSLGTDWDALGIVFLHAPTNAKRHSQGAYTKSQAAAANSHKDPGDMGGSGDPRPPNNSIGSCTYNYNRVVC